MPFVVTVPGDAGRGEGCAEALLQQAPVLQRAKVAPDGLVRHVELGGKTLRPKPRPANAPLRGSAIAAA